MRPQDTDAALHKLPSVALIMPPPWAVGAPPIAPYLLQTILRSAGVRSQVYDLNLKLYHVIGKQLQGLWELGASKYWMEGKVYDNFSKLPGFRRIEEELGALDADILAFSINTSNITFTTTLIRRLKAAGCKKKIVFGGPAIQKNPNANRDRYPLYSLCFMVDKPKISYEKACAELYSLCDVQVLAEGEVTFLEVLQRMASGERYPVPGAMFSDDVGIVPFTPRPLIEALHSIPFPHYDGYEFTPDRPTSSFIHILGNRGCVRRCIFCSETRLWERFRARASDHLAEEIIHHARTYGVRFFEFADPLLNGNMTDLEELCDYLIEADLGVTFNGNMIVHRKMDDAMFKKLYRAGFTTIMTGIESGSNTVLKSMKKGFVSSQATAFLRDAKANRVHTICNFIVGFPTETKDDFEQTLDFLRANAAQIGQIGVIDTCILYKDTELFEKREQFGISFEHGISKVGASEHWVNDAVGDHFNRYERLYRFAQVCREYNIPYPLKTAAITGDIHNTFALGTMDMAMRTEHIIYAKQRLRKRGIPLVLEQKDEDLYLVLSFLERGDQLQQDVCFTYLLLNYTPRLTYFYRCFFSEMFKPLTFPQYYSKQLLLFVSKKNHGPALDAHLIDLLQCSDSHLCYIASRCLLLRDRRYHLNHLQRFFENYHRIRLQDEVDPDVGYKHAHDLFQASNAQRYYAVTDAGPLPKELRKNFVLTAPLRDIVQRALQEHAPIFDELSSHIQTLLYCYMNGDAFDRELVLRNLICNHRQELSTLLPVFHDEVLAPLPPLQHPTMQLLHSLVFKNDKRPDMALGMLAKRTRLQMDPYLADSSDPTSLYADAAAFLGLTDIRHVKRQIQWGKACCKRAGIAFKLPPEDLALFALLYFIAKKAAPVSDTAFALLLRRYQPRLSAFYLAIFTQKLIPLGKLSNHALQIFGRFVQLGPKDFDKILLAIIQSGEPKMKTIARAFLADCDFHTAVDMLSHFRRLPGSKSAASKLNPYMLYDTVRIYAWFQGDIALFSAKPLLQINSERDSLAYFTAVPPLEREMLIRFLLVRNPTYAGSTLTKLAQLPSSALPPLHHTTAQSLYDAVKDGTIAPITCQYLLSATKPWTLLDVRQHPYVPSGDALDVLIEQAPDATTRTERDLWRYRQALALYEAKTTNPWVRGLATAYLLAHLKAEEFPEFEKFCVVEGKRSRGTKPEIGIALASSALVQDEAIQKALFQLQVSSKGFLQLLPSLLLAHMDMRTAMRYFPDMFMERRWNTFDKRTKLAFAQCKFLYDLWMKDDVKSFLAITMHDSALASDNIACTQNWLDREQTPGVQYQLQYILERQKLAALSGDTPVQHHLQRQGLLMLMRIPAFGVAFVKALPLLPEAPLRGKPGKVLDIPLSSAFGKCDCFCVALVANNNAILFADLYTSKNPPGQEIKALRIPECNALLTSSSKDTLHVVVAGACTSDVEKGFHHFALFPLAMEQQPRDGGGFIYSPTIFSVESVVSKGCALRCESNFEGYGAPANLSFHFTVPAGHEHAMARVQVFAASDSDRLVLLYGQNSHRHEISLQNGMSYQAILSIAHLNLTGGEYVAIGELLDANRHVVARSDLRISLPNLQPKHVLPKGPAHFPGGIEVLYSQSFPR